MTILIEVKEPDNPASYSVLIDNTIDEYGKLKSLVNLLIGKANSNSNKRRSLLATTKVL